MNSIEAFKAQEEKVRIQCEEIEKNEKKSKKE